MEQWVDWTDGRTVGWMLSDVRYIHTTHTRVFIFTKISSSEGNRLAFWLLPLVFPGTSTQDYSVCSASSRRSSQHADRFQTPPPPHKIDIKCGVQYSVAFPNKNNTSAELTMIEKRESGHQITHRSSASNFFTITKCTFIAVQRCYFKYISTTYILTN